MRRPFLIALVVVSILTACNTTPPSAVRLAENLSDAQKQNVGDLEQLVAAVEALFKDEAKRVVAPLTSLETAHHERLELIEALIALARDHNKEPARKWAGNPIVTSFQERLKQADKLRTGLEPWVSKAKYDLELFGKADHVALDDAALKDLNSMQSKMIEPYIKGMRGDVSLPPGISNTTLKEWLEELRNKGTRTSADVAGRLNSVLKMIIQREGTLTDYLETIRKAESDLNAVREVLSKSLDAVRKKTKEVQDAVNLVNATQTKAMRTMVENARSVHHGQESLAQSLKRSEQIYQNLQATLVGGIKGVGGFLEELDILSENDLSKLNAVVDNADAMLQSAVETGLWPKEDRESK